MPAQEQPALIVTGEVARRLEIGRPTLQNMFGSIPHLYVTRRETRLFPAPYIDAYVAYLRQRYQPAIIATAREFWATQEAQRLTEAAQQRIEAGLRGMTLTTSELMSLLCISRMAITNWHQAGVIRVVEQTVRPKRSRGKGPKKVLLIPTSEVRQALEWRLPPR